MTATNLKRALFLNHQIWCTPFESSERFPGGDFPNQLVGIDGLPKWTKANRSILDTDLVVWHVFGVTHLPRPEDWPIMPTEHCGFHMKPSSFFSCSPVTDTKAQQVVHCCK
jgi:primary-amine oxidase